MTRFAVLLAAFSALLAQTGSKEKISAIRALTRQGGESAIRALSGYLQETDAEVRREAVKGIAIIGTAASLDPLAGACRDSDPEVQIRAVDGLVNFYLPGYISKSGLVTGGVRRLGRGIQSRFTDTNDQVIENHITVRTEVVDAVRHVIARGANLEAQAVAARAAGIFRARAASPELLTAVKSKDTNLIYESIIAIQKIRDPDNAPGISFLLRDLNPKVQMAAIETAGLLRNKSALPSLAETVNQARSGKIKSAALAAMAMMPDESSRPYFDKHLADRDEDLRAAAAEGFARLNRASDAERLDKAFEGETRMKPRLSMAFASVSLGRKDFSDFGPLKYLVNTLNSSSYHQVAAAFLQELARDRAVRETLAASMGQRTAAEKVLLAGALAASGDPSLIPVFENLARDPDPQVGQAATRGLRALRDRPASAPARDVQ